MAEKKEVTTLLAIGSKVKWNAQASGYSKPREGEILAYVPALTKVPLEGVDTSVLSRLTFDPNGKTAHDRYLIAIRTPRTTRYSTPPASSVSLIVNP